MLFKFSLVLHSSAEILSSDLTLHIHLTILVWFISSLITSSSLTDQVSHPYNIMLHTHAEHNLPFPKFHKTDHLIICLDNPLLCLFDKFHINLQYSFSLPLIPLHLLCTQHLQNWHRMELLPTTILETTQRTLFTPVLLFKLPVSLSGPQKFH